MNIFLVIFLISFKCLAQDSWRDGDLETIVGKDKTVIDWSYGAVQELRKLLNQSAITSEIYQKEIGEQMIIISKFVEYDITTETEMDDVFDFFVKSKGSYTKSSATSGVFTFTNVLLIIAIALIVISSGSLAAIYIVPWLASLSESTQIALAYIASILFLIIVKLAGDFKIQNYLALLGAIGLAGAYFFHLSHMPHTQEPPWTVILLPVVITWGFLAIIFKTQLIGFITVGAFEGMFGFFIWTGPLSTTIGFEKDDLIPTALVASGTLLALYIVHVLRFFSVAESVYNAISVFEPGVFFIGTFVFFTGLLISSSRWYKYDRKVLIYNILAVVVGLLSFYLGSLVPGLTVFRGVASTFFVLFLMQKYIEIPWGECWACGLLGGAILLIGVCYFVKSNPGLFVFG